MEIDVGALTRGYFGVGVQRLSKSLNAGNLFRSAHGFGASFCFTVGSPLTRKQVEYADTSKGHRHMPYYDFNDVNSLMLPKGCALVGVELTDEAVELPSFHHPLNAAYVMGPEKGSLSEDLLERCDHVVKIPTKFCINVAMAGVVVMYDRQISLGRFRDRPMLPG